MAIRRTTRKKSGRRAAVKRPRSKLRAEKRSGIGSGLQSFSMHALDQKSAPIFARLQQERASYPAFALGGAATIPQLDPETVAKGYLNQALASKAVRSFTAPKSAGITSEFKSLGSESVPLTGTK